MIQKTKLNQCFEKKWLQFQFKVMGFHGIRGGELLSTVKAQSFFP
jgi:hypothetical protein